jgi:hypothetical protein
MFNVLQVVQYVRHIPSNPTARYVRNSSCMQHAVKSKFFADAENLSAKQKFAFFLFFCVLDFYLLYSCRASSIKAYKERAKSGTVSSTSRR